MKCKIKATTWSNGIENCVEQEPRLQLGVHAIPPSKPYLYKPFTTLFSLLTIHFLSLSLCDQTNLTLYLSTIQGM